MTPPDRPDKLRELRDATAGSSLRKLAAWASTPLRLAGERRGLPAQRAPIDLTPQAVAAPDARTKPYAILASFIIVVLVPFALAGIYFFFIASDQYMVETRFAVRTLATDNQGRSDLPNVLAVASAFRSQDADIVANYIESRTIIDDVSPRLDIRGIFQRPEADFYTRLKKDASIEDLTSYWKRMVSVYIEATSGIVTLDVRAFRREDALALTNAILRASEVAVEDLSRHVRDETVKHAEDEVQRSAGLVHASLIDLQSFRNAQGIIDPVKSADATGKLLVQLLSDKIQLESQIFVAQQTTGPNAPGVASLRARLDSTNTQIADLQQQMAGGKDTKSNLAALISKFEELDLKRQFAQKLYAMTQEGLVRARLAAERRAVYLTVFAPPALPEEATYPLRLSWTFLIGMGALLAWCSGATIWASIQDHKL